MDIDGHSYYYSCFCKECIKHEKQLAKTIGKEPNKYVVKSLPNISEEELEHYRKHR